MLMLNDHILWGSFQTKSVVLRLQRAEEGHRVVRNQGSHIIFIIGWQMVVRLSASCAGHHLAPWRFLALISVRSCTDDRAIVQLEGLGQLKTLMTVGIEPMTFQLVAWCFNQLLYVPDVLWLTIHKSSSVMESKIICLPFLYHKILQKKHAKLIHLDTKLKRSLHCLTL
jgi:hypothetical protein